MTLPLIISLCLLVLIAYAFDITSKHTKIPTVIFLLILGWLMKYLVDFFNFKIVDLNPLLPIFGTLGLILIVLEGGLELEINKDKKQTIQKSALSAFVPLLVLSMIFGVLINYFTGADFMKSVVNAIPFCVISSAIAIPSVQNLGAEKKEIVIYESSLSDIFGVILFNFFMANEIIGINSFLHFFMQLFIILIISLVASIGLAYFIKKIDNHVKMIPIMVMVFLIYAIAKEFHLPALVFILIFGLFLNNLDELKSFVFIQKLEPKILDLEVFRFTKLVAEAAFLIRTIFFILFGYTIKTEALLDQETLPYAIGIIMIVLIIRFVQLKISKNEVYPLLFVAPRGLITIMLFISIPLSRKISFVNESLMIQVIVISILVMMLGLIFAKNKKQIPLG